MGTVKRPNAGKRLERADWVRRAVGMATRGWSVRKIGAAIGKSHTAVLKALHAEFERIRPTEDELEAAREIHREKLLRRESKLNQLIVAHWPSAKKKLAAAKVVILADRSLDQVHEKLARLDGLNAPERKEISGKDGAPIVFDLTGLSNEQLQQLAAKLAEPDAGDEGVAPAADPRGAGTSTRGDGEPT